MNFGGSLSEEDVDDGWTQIRAAVRDRLNLRDFRIDRSIEGNSFDDLFHEAVIVTFDRDGEINLDSFTKGSASAKASIAETISEEIRKNWAVLGRRAQRRAGILDALPQVEESDASEKISYVQQVELIAREIQDDIEARCLLACFASGVDFHDNVILSAVLKISVQRVQNAKKRLIRSANKVRLENPDAIRIDGPAKKRGSQK